MDDEADDEKVEVRRGGILATSGVEENAMRLLGAFYDLSGEKLTEPVSLGGPERPGQGAAPRADLDPSLQSVRLRPDTWSTRDTSHRPMLRPGT